MNTLILFRPSFPLFLFLKRSFLRLGLAASIFLGSHASVRDDASSSASSSGPHRLPSSLADEKAAATRLQQLQAVIHQINAITEERGQLHAQIQSYKGRIEALSQQKAISQFHTHLFTQLVLNLLKKRNKKSNHLLGAAFETIYQEYASQQPPALPSPSFKLDFDKKPIDTEVKEKDPAALKSLLRYMQGQHAVAQQGLALLALDLTKQETTYGALSKELETEGISPEKLACLTTLQQTLKTQLQALLGPPWISFVAITHCLQTYAQQRDLLEDAGPTPCFTLLKGLFAQHGCNLLQESVV